MDTGIEVTQYTQPSPAFAPDNRYRRLSEAAIRRYGIALLFVTAALVLTLALRPLFPYPFFLLFFPAVMGGAWYGGTSPGLFAVLLSTLLVDYFLVPPLYSLAVKATDTAYFGAFVMCSMAASWVSSVRKKREELLLDARNELEVHVAERTAELEKSHTELHEHERQFRLLTEALPQHLMGVASNGSENVSAEACLQNVLSAVVEFSTSVVPCDSCFIYVLEGDELVLGASKNPHPKVVNRLKLKTGQGIADWVAQQRQPVVVAQDAYRDQRFQLFNELEDRFEAFLSVPLSSRGRLVGVINLQNRDPHQFSQREIRLISTIGFLIGAEIEMARLEVENLRLADKLETRKIVERAKGIIQRELRIGEEEAYLTLQRESRQRGKTMREVSDAILLNEDIRQRKE